MGLRGPEPQQTCKYGHDMGRYSGNVREVVSAKGYVERRCIECLKRRNRENWKKHGKKYIQNQKDKRNK